MFERGPLNISGRVAQAEVLLEYGETGKEAGRDSTTTEGVGGIFSRKL